MKYIEHEVGGFNQTRFSREETEYAIDQIPKPQKQDQMLIHTCYPVAVRVDGETLSNVDRAPFTRTIPTRPATLLR